LAAKIAPMTSIHDGGYCERQAGPADSQLSACRKKGKTNLPLSRRKIQRIKKTSNGRFSVTEKPITRAMGEKYLSAGRFASSGGTKRWLKILSNGRKRMPKALKRRPGGEGKD